MAGVRIYAVEVVVPSLNLGASWKHGTLTYVIFSYGKFVGIALIGFRFCGGKTLEWRQNINISGLHISLK